MPQKKKAVKKDVKKVTKPKPPLKDSINVKIAARSETPVFIGWSHVQTKKSRWFSFSILFRSGQARPIRHGPARPIQTGLGVFSSGPLRPGPARAKPTKKF